MSKLKIRFLKDHQQFDEKMFEFAKGEVCAMNEASAMHYVNRQVAELVGSGTKLGKSEKQIELDPPAKDKTLGQKIKEGAKSITGSKKSKSTGKK